LDDRVSSPIALTPLDGLTCPKVQAIQERQDQCLEPVLVRSHSSYSYRSNVSQSNSGGHYGPAIANLLQTRADAIKNGKKRSCNEIAISVDTVGIISGFIEFLAHVPSFPIFAINNTYGIKVYSDEIAESAATNYTMPGGCLDQATNCRSLTPNGYRDQFGTNETVTEVCGDAFACGK
jgi:hypothetical protein